MWMLDEFGNALDKFVIPVYQRRYSWKEDNCKALFDDIVRIAKGVTDTHFCGSVVLKMVDHDRIVIDGQQRLTTISLLLLAIMKNVDEEKRDEIESMYLKTRKGEPKIIAVYGDKEPYEAILAGDEERIEKMRNSRQVMNYLYFCDKVVRSDVDAASLYSAIRKLKVVEITLGDGDDPQLIFESINSTGLALTEADKIRNYLLMSLPVDRQAAVYADYWLKMEEWLGDDLSSFFRDYLTMKRGEIPNVRDLYIEFKKYVGFEGDKEVALADLLENARLYNGFMRFKTGKPKVDNWLRDFSTMNFTIVRPYLLAFFGYAKQNSLSEDDMLEVLLVVENYIVRRAVCQVPSNCLNKLFATLHKRIEEERGKQEEGLRSSYRYREVLVGILRSRTGGISSRFPDDEEVRQQMAMCEMYNMRSNTRNFILARLENGNNNDGLTAGDVIGRLYTNDNSKKITIEHVMPQTLSDEWREILGDDCDRIHEEYLHKIANLTLTAYNSELSNAPFDVKQNDASYGYKQANYQLNEILKKVDTWGEEQLKERMDWMVERFIRKVWPMPEARFVLSRGGGNLVECSLAENGVDYYTGKTLEAYEFEGERKGYDVDWKSMALYVLGQIVESDDGEVLRELCESNQFGLSVSPNDYRKEFADGLYFVTGCDTKTKISNLRQIFDRIGRQQEDLVFTMSVS